MIIEISPKKIEYSKKIQSLCGMPYHKHPHGCPNHGTRETCPPHQPLINEVFDFDSGLYVVYTEFSVGEFAERMRRGHPQWKKQPRQWYNPRRWQPKARKEHQTDLETFLEQHPEFNVNTSPEAHGVNVTALMEELGINLDWQWPPEHTLKNKKYLENKVYLVSLGGKLI